MGVVVDGHTEHGVSFFLFLKFFPPSYRRMTKNAKKQFCPFSFLFDDWCGFYDQLRRRVFFIRE